MVSWNNDTSICSYYDDSYTIQFCFWTPLRIPYQAYHCLTATLKRNYFHYLIWNKTNVLSLLDRSYLRHFSSVILSHQRYVMISSTARFLYDEHKSIHSMIPSPRHSSRTGPWRSMFEEWLVVESQLCCVIACLSANQCNSFVLKLCIW